MSIPFSPTRADSPSEGTEEHIFSEEQNELLEPAGGDGAPEIVSDEEWEAETSRADEAPVEDVSSVDQIREILFGRQMSAYEERFSLLEKRILVATEVLRQEVGERLDSLDAYIREETDGMGRRITQERDVRTVAVEELIASVRQHRDALGKRMDGVEEASNEVAEALRAQEARETRTDDLQKRLDENLSALRSQKMDYQTLATLLADMAARLSEGDGEV
ncbi:MAG: hypothetical protein IH855_03445 [Bacteroidetes bacterium]|nr:hypothetical protein [Bacteroidota bacterium]